MFKLSTLVSEDELMEECGFWKKYTGISRNSASNAAYRFFYFCNVAFRAVIIIFMNFFHARNNSHETRAKCILLLLYFSKNQKTAMRAWQGKGVEIQEASFMPCAEWHVCWLKCGLLTLKYLLPTYRMLRKRPDFADTIPWLGEFVRYQAGLVLASELYKKVQPLSVMVSNDHSGIFRAFIRVAKLNGIKLIYTQHGSIGKNFPALKFDLSLLDGLQAFLQYRESGMPIGNVVITGRVKLSIDSDQLSNLNVPHVGLATNTVDSLYVWIKILRAIQGRYACVYMRCHPAEKRKLIWRFICWFYGVKFHTSSLDDFFTKITVLLSGTSGIVLDGALRGVPVLVREPRNFQNSEMKDYYGYEQFGLCKVVDNLSQLPELILKHSNNKVDSAQVSIFDAGTIQDPDEEKWAAVMLFLSEIAASSQSFHSFERRYSQYCCKDVILFVTEEYHSIIKDHKYQGLLK